MSFQKKVLFTVVILAFLLLVVELLGAAVMFYVYKKDIASLRGYASSSILLSIQKAVNRMRPVGERDKRTIKSVPSPLYVPDSAYGYVHRPGTYRISIYKPDYPQSKPYSYKATILEDGSRYVGGGRKPIDGDTSHVFVYGDSFVFGEGVNDEQTFSYLLQQAHPDRNVRLSAIGGGSLTNAYVDFQQNKSRLNENDVIILGFAEFYLARHVAAPSRLRVYGKRLTHYSPNLRHLKADLDSSGDLVITTVPLFCEEAGDYCEQKDPDRAYQRKVAAKLINDIARGTRAKVLLLFMRAYEQPEPVLSMLDPSVTVVSCTETDFEDQVHDQIMDYDPHPGPFWHYAVYSRLDARIRTLF